ncbi:class I SAM-dependent methyltransferase [Micromonospora coxensis]|uniref:class I SAM-dependent methyltransferase n=1 Tax=Micromonospora coxensis TaxID=356852 RepID=UPI000B5AC6B6|nr:class I SAM-dependent methyltransferase [Micromonospora coxensis]
MRDAEFTDPRLVAVYDAECGWSADDDFFLAEVGAAPLRVLDFGCGTGRLTLALAAAGHTVTGVDPARASLAAARAKPGAERVDWVEGSREVLPVGAYDVALMTSHVAQFLTDDGQWRATLAALRAALVDGGRLLFDSRDPADRRWQRWNPVDSRRHVPLPDGGTVRVWTEVTAVRDGGLVEFCRHYRFPGGERLRSRSVLRFRDETRLRADLAAAGFRVDRVHGGWHGEAVGTGGDGELVVAATARAADKSVGSRGDGR